jgi:hypothetical protein
VNNASHKRTKTIMEMSYLGAHEIDLTFRDLDGLFDGSSRCELILCAALRYIHIGYKTNIVPMD